MKSRRKRPEPLVDRPALMRIDEARCTHCDACFDLAPVIRLDAQRIPVCSATLDAMADCPAGALVWLETAPAVEGASEADG